MIEAGLGVDFGGWWVVDIYHGRIEPIFYVSRDFSYPRDAKFCDEYARKGLVLITSLLEEDGLARSRHYLLCHGSLLLENCVYHSVSEAVFSCVGTLLVDMSRYRALLVPTFISRTICPVQRCVSYQHS